MLKKACKKIFAAILIMAMICGIFPNFGDSQEQVKASSIPKYVVVLDAGHDASHAGAQNRSNGYREEVLTYKIASYCKQELEKHDGVKVYMVRDSYSCPFGGGSVKSTECNSKRVEFSKNVKADLYISFHLNSSGPSARGVSVYYPNMNYKSEIGRNGEVLAKDIIKRLKESGKFNSLPEELKEIAKLREENPDATCEELGNMLQTPIKKSSVSHRFKKIEGYLKEK